MEPQGKIWKLRYTLRTGFSLFTVHLAAVPTWLRSCEQAPHMLLQQQKVKKYFTVPNFLTLWPKWSPSRTVQRRLKSPAAQCGFWRLYYYYKMRYRHITDFWYCREVLYLPDIWIWVISLLMTYQAHECLNRSLKQSKLKNILSNIPLILLLLRVKTILE